jgi:hypothetical protein
MTRMHTQPGITPPVPGLDKEEPELWNEEDIPTPSNDRSDRGSASDSDSGRDEKPQRDRER